MPLLPVPSSVPVLIAETVRDAESSASVSSFNTSSWIYYGRAKEGGRILSQDRRRVEVPTGCAVYPKEFLSWPPKSYVERLFNVVHWTEMNKGGHFAALEQPSSLIKDIRDFYKKVWL